MCALRMVICRPAIMIGVLLLPSGGMMTSHRGETARSHVSAIVVTRADSGRVVEARVGDSLVLRLEENPATGYRWAIEEHDENAVPLHHVEYRPSQGTGIGGSGQRTWVFIAQKAGIATLQLKLWRAWEGDSSIVRRFTVTFDVRE